MEGEPAENVPRKLEKWHYLSSYQPWSHRQVETVIEEPSTIKNLPAMWETQVQTLDWEDPLEKGMATHFSILAWRIPWTEEAGGLQSMGVAKSQTRLNNQHTYTYIHTHTSHLYPFIINLYIDLKWKLLNHVPFFETPWTVAMKS